MLQSVQLLMDALQYGDSIFDCFPYNFLLTGVGVVFSRYPGSTDSQTTWTK